MDKPQKLPTTVEMAPPPDWAIALSQKVVDGFAEVEKRLDSMEANIDIQKSAVQDVMGRLTRVEERQNSSSLRAKSASEIDASHDAAIASLTEKVDALEKKADASLVILGKLEGVAANPLVRRVAYAVGTVVVLYLGAVTTRLQAQSEHPAPVPVQVVAVPVAAADGGAP